MTAPYQSSYTGKLLAGFAVSAMAILAVGVVMVGSIRNMTNEQNAAATEATKILLSLKDLSLYLQQSKAANQTYLLTGDSRYLGTSRNARKEFLKILQDLRMQMPGSGTREWFGTIASIEEHKQKLFERLSARKRLGAPNAEIRQKIETRYLPEVSQIETVLAAIIREQESKLADALNKERIHANRTITNIVVLSAVLILLAGLLTALLQRTAIRLRRSTDALREHAMDQTALAELSQHALSATAPADMLRHIGQIIRRRLGVDDVEFLDLRADLMPTLANTSAMTLTDLLDSKPGLRSAALSEKTLLLSEIELKKMGNHKVDVLFASIPGRAGPKGIIGAWRASEIGLTNADARFLAKAASAVASLLHRVSMELALQQSEEQTRTLLNSTAEGIVGVDLEGACIFANAASLEMLGYQNLDELKGRKFHDIAHGNDPAGSSSHDPRSCSGFRALPTREVFHSEDEVMWRKNGTFFNVEYWVHPVHKDHTLVGAVYAFSDISARKRAESQNTFLSTATLALSSSIDYAVTLRTITRLAVPRLADCCMIMTRDGDNPDLIGSLELAVKDPVKETEVRALVEKALHSHPSIPRGGAIGEVLESGKPAFYLSNVEALQTIFPEERDHEIVAKLDPKSIIVVPIVIRDNVNGALILLRSSGRHYDWTDLGLTEELTRRAAIALENAFLYRRANEAIRTRDDFLSIASHELKTPLTSLHLQLQLLRRGLHKATTGEQPTLAPMAKLVEESERQSRRLAAMLDLLLDMSRIRAGKVLLNPEPIELGSLIADAIARLSAQAANAGSPITFIGGTEIQGQWDRMRLDQVITNLISNAIKYGAGKPVEVTLTASNGKAQLAVTDHGIGIPADQHEKVFERFQRGSQTGKISGLGLGLYIARHLARAHGGDITVESEPGKGSTFTLQVPMIAPATATLKKRTNPDQDSSSAQILV